MYTPLRRLKQEDYRLWASLDYTVIFCPKAKQGLGMGGGSSGKALAMEA